MHVLGTSWTSNYDGPTNEQLRDPSNWSLAYCDPRLIPLDRSGGERGRCLPAYHRYLRLIRLSLVNNTGVLQRGLLFFARLTPCNTLCYK